MLTEKGTRIQFILSSIVALLTIALIVLIILMTVKRPKKYSEARLQDKNIMGLESFNFVQDKEIPEYPHDNLGLAGQLILECYIGTCIKEIYHKNIKTYCDYDDYCYDVDEGWYEYRPTIDHDCSEQCYVFGKKECNCSSNYHEEKGTCERKNNDQYAEGKVCFAYNTIYFWRGKKYKISKTTNYTYLSNAILKDEECPNGYKDCGIIDPYENRLCISSRDKCPINYISESKTNEVYASIVFENKTLYYGNDPTTPRKKIVVGLVADSDLYLNRDNNKKDIVDTYTISGFLEDNKNLYKEVNLGYDPYKTEDIDSKGNSYLRTYYNEGINLTELRQRSDRNNFNHKMNKQALNTIKYKTKVISILGLIACGYLLLGFIYILFYLGKFLKKSQRNDKKKCYICFIVVFLALIIVPLIFGCLNLVKLNKAKEIDPTVNYNTFRKLNIAFITIGFVLFLFLIIYMILLFIKIKEKSHENKIDNTEADINNTKANEEKK